MKTNLVITHSNRGKDFISTVENLDNGKRFIVGIYSSIEKRHKLEKRRLKMMIENPSTQFKIFLKPIEKQGIIL